MDELKKEVQVEKEHILTTLRALKEAMERKEKTIIELAAISTFLQNIYNGIENLLKRILKFLGKTIIKSKSWHKELLDLAVDTKIITFLLSKKLDEYSAFRHFSIHGYGIKLDKQKLFPLAENLPKLWEELESEISSFLEKEPNGE